MRDEPSVREACVLSAGGGGGMSNAMDQATQGRLMGRSRVEDLVIVPLFAFAAALSLGALVMVAASQLPTSMTWRYDAPPVTE